MTNHEINNRLRLARLHANAKWFAEPPLAPASELKSTLIVRGPLARKRLDTLARV